MRNENQYKTLLRGLKDAFEEQWKNEPSDGLKNAMRRFVMQEYVLLAFGDALAKERTWTLSGMDAIEYAIILKFSWSVEDVRSLPLRDKWLVLHDELKASGFPNDAQTAWDSIHGEGLILANAEIWEAHPK